MRIEIGILTVAFLVGTILFIVAALLGFGSTAQLLFASAIIMGLALCLFTFMAQKSNSIQEIVKQIAVWLGVVALLPLSVWYGTSVFSPPPDWKKHSKAESRLQEKIREAEDKAEKDTLRRELDQLQQEHDEAERVFYRDMFWVAYPLGLLAIIAGTFFPVQAVGAGLMFGGLISLAAGCYSYWDRMDGWLRFGSLILALVVIMALGTWRFPPTNQVESQVT